MALVLKAGICQVYPIQLQKQKLPVLTPDLRGHGNNIGEKGDVEYIGQLENDIEDLIEFSKQNLKADKFTREIMQADDYKLDNLFWGNPPEKEKLDFTLQKIISNIEKIKKILI